MNAITAIHPYKDEGLWVFDDANVGLLREPFVSGADEIIERMVQDMPNAASGFTLLFSATPFPGHQSMLEWRRSEMGGNWYYSADVDMEGWLCPALFRYFEVAPARIYAQFATLVPDVEAKAHCFLKMGQLVEQARDYRAAVGCYREALALKPSGVFVRYFINNNLGFSLNVLGDCAEGEIYCRQAIEIDPGRPNGHKNLGIALAGQGFCREAAECFVAATQANALDPRSFNLLTQLLESHPQLEVEFSEVARLCGEAVEQARRNIH